MIHVWRYFIRVVLIVIFEIVFSEQFLEVHQTNWIVVESLAEENPHIVALLNKKTKYLCTGTVISSKTVLTSGTCINPSLFYIAIGTAVINSLINTNNLFVIEKAILHGDFSFQIENRNVTKLHSNLGLVFSMKPVLDNFAPAANIGNYYASELRSKDLTAVGYGWFGNTDNVVLQAQIYHQQPCYNPKWYYCVCGYELAKFSGTVQPFGEGAPVYLGSELIGVTATPCKTLEIKSLSRKYNIITVIGPYMPWIEKTYNKFSNVVVLRSVNDAEKSTFPCCLIVIIVLVILKFYPR